VLTPVLVGLGLFSTFSVSCLIWLERLQPLFFGVAVMTLIYQVWIVKRRPPFLRTRAVKAILGVSVVVNSLMIVGWVVLTIRYW
jgi:hypothetical protein